MWRLALLASVILVVLASLLMSTVVLDWLIDSYLIVVAFLKTIATWVISLLGKVWAWIIIGLKSLRFYDIFWLMLIPRLKRFAIIDMPYRFLSNHILPILLLDARNRKLIRERMESLTALVKAGVSRSVEWWVMYTGWIFGRYARMVLGTLITIVIAIVVYLIYGAYLVLGLVPIPQPVIRFLQAIWSLILTLLQSVIEVGKQAIFRLAVLLGLTGLWARLHARVVSEERRRAFRRRRIRIVRSLIGRRRYLSGRLQGLTAWQRFVRWWFKLWDSFFGRIEEVHQRIQVPLAARNLRSSLECQFCTLAERTPMPDLRGPVICDCRSQATSVPA